jgi:hypothetical protein
MFKRVQGWASRLRSNWATISFEKKVSMFVAPIVVAVATAVLVPRVAGGGNGGGDGEEGQAVRSNERLEVVDLGVHNSPDGTSIDLSVRNIGELVSVATSARFRIRSFAILGACLPEAYLLPTHKYPLVLPTEDAKGQTRDVKISQEIGPNEADRFTFPVTVDDPQLTSTVSYLYRIDVAVFHDRRPTPVRAGEVWLAEPFPKEHWFSLRDDLGSDPFDEEVKQCVEENKADLSAIQRGGAKSSPELMSFAQTVL